MDYGPKSPSSKWKVRYGLLLGLERVLAESEMLTSAGTPLQSHQNDALAGKHNELITASKHYDELNDNGNGNGNGQSATVDELEQQQVEDEDEDSTLVVEIEDAELPEEPQEDV